MLRCIGRNNRGCPAGIEIDLEAIQFEMSEKKTRTICNSYPRKEPDDVQFYGNFWVKRQEHPLVLLFQIQIKNRMTIHIKDTIIDPVIPIMYMKKSYGIP
jgi:chorismate synthase